MILSLFLATVIFIPVVSFVGILPVGEILFGENAAMLSAANTTMHATYSAVGLTVVIPVFVLGALALGVAVIYAMKKAGLENDVQKRNGQTSVCR